MAEAFRVFPPRPEGLLVSSRALALVEFLEESGGAPPAACRLLWPDADDRFRRAYGAGFAAWASLGSRLLWLPRVHRVRGPRGFARQEALGWLAARLREAGGAFRGGQAVFPSRAALPVAVIPPDAPPAEPSVVVVTDGTEPHIRRGSPWCTLEDLRDRPLRECLQAGAL
jgi:hypothetical protein